MFRDVIAKAAQAACQLRRSLRFVRRQFGVLVYVQIERMGVWIDSSDFFGRCGSLCECRGSQGGQEQKFGESHRGGRISVTTAMPQPSPKEYQGLRMPQFPSCTFVSLVVSTSTPAYSEYDSVPPIFFSAVHRATTGS